MTIDTQWKLLALYQEVAGMLVKPEKVVIRWKAPVSVLARGETSRDMKGTFVIDLSNGTPLLSLFEVFCHEIGHIVAHGDKIKRTRHFEKAPGSDWSTKRLKLSPKRQALEDQALNYAKLLSGYAMENMHKFQRIGEPQVCACLRALWQSGGVITRSN